LDHLYGSSLFVIFVLRRHDRPCRTYHTHTMVRSNVGQPLPNEMLGPLTVAVVPRHLDNAPQHRWPRRKLSSARCSGAYFCCWLRVSGNCISHEQCVQHRAGVVSPDVETHRDGATLHVQHDFEGVAPFCVFCTACCVLCMSSRRKHPEGFLKDG